MSEEELNEFIRLNEAEQDRLRRELEPYEARKLVVGQGPVGGPVTDVTQRRIEEIKAEIARYGRTVAIVRALWEGRHDA